MTDHNALRHGAGAMALACAAALAATSADAHDGPHAGGIRDKAADAKPAFDIVHTRITTEGDVAVFHMAISGKAGASKPSKSGKLAGADVFSYVWPTSLDPATVGFEGKAGILALAVTAHPDFDDTPLYDENRDGDRGDDGDLWHSHWVVLAPDEACGKGALKVRDIPDGARPKLPRTWPGLPIYIDSPGWDPTFSGPSVEVRVAFDDIAAVRAAAYDGVTAGLRVNASVHSPLLCVVNVFDIASETLSLPGKVD